MRKSLIAAGLSLAILFAGQPGALACGDKLISLTGGVRMQRAYMAVHPANILIYNSQNGSAGSLGKADLQSSLKKAGHKLLVVGNAVQAQGLLQSGQFDLILADLADAGSLAEQAKATPSKPTVLPVMYKPAKQEFVAAEKKFGLVLKAQGQPAEFLVAIDQAMKVRLRSARS